MPKAEYRSAIRSRKLITDALADLLLQKPLDKITVSDIVRKAEINRGTFYAHYQDVPDVISHIIQQTFDSIREVLDDVPAQITDIPQVLLVRIQTLLENDLEFYKKVMSSGAATFMKDMLVDIVLDYLYRQQIAYGFDNQEQYILMMRFCAGGLATLYTDWLSGKLDVSLTELTRMASDLIESIVQSQI